MTDSRKADRSSVDDMELLQNLILGGEKDRLHKLDQRVSGIESRTKDVAEVLTTAMNQLAEDPVSRLDFEKPIVNTIRTTIMRDAHSFAEALFPVLGPAIRLAVADTLKSVVQRINIALENSFTFKGLRWRLEAARTRVPFAQIVLRHTMLYSVQEAFLIQRSSGLVLASLYRDKSLALDEDAMTSMLIAIQSFVQDSFSVEGYEPLRSIELGEQTIWVFNGPYAVLACVISGTPPRSVRNELTELLETMHTRFGQQLNAHPEGLADNQGIRSLMMNVLREEVDEGAQSSTRLKYKLIWSIATVLLVLYLVSSSLGAYWDRQFTRQVVSLFQSEPGYVLTGSFMVDGVLSLDGLKDPSAVPVEQILADKQIQAEKLKINFSPYQSLEPTIIIQRIRQQLLIDPDSPIELNGRELIVGGMLTMQQTDALRGLPRIHALIQNVLLDDFKYPADEAARKTRAALSAPDSVRFLPTGDRIVVSGTSSASWFVSAQQAEIELGGWQLDFSPLRSDLSLQFKDIAKRLDGTMFLFLDGIQLTSESEDKLLEVGRELAELQALAMALNQDISIVLEGLGDGTGTFEKNLELATMRSRRVLEYLVSHGVSPTGVTHTTGDWQQGRYSLAKRRVTMILRRNPAS